MGLGVLGLFLGHPRIIGGSQKRIEGHNMVGYIGEYVSYLMGGSQRRIEGSLPKSMIATYAPSHEDLKGELKALCQRGRGSRH